MLGDIRSGLVLLTALAVSAIGWWLVVAEPATLPGFICGVTGYEATAGAWSAGLLIGRLAMWLPMMLAMALPVGIVIGLRSGRAPDAAFLAGYAGTAAGIAVVAAVAEWSLLSWGSVDVGVASGMLAGASFIALGVFNLCSAAIRRSSSCMEVSHRIWPLVPHPAAFRGPFSPLKRADGMQGRSERHGQSPRAQMDALAGSVAVAFLHGLHQGRASLTCSITMVGLQLVLGTMSLVLMVGMTLWMLAEAVLPQRRELPAALGAALVMAGVSVIAMAAVT